MILPTRTNHLSSNNFFLLSGPCAIESKELMITVASRVNSICERLEIPFILKGSYKKANRSRLDSFTGIGDEKALRILQEVGGEIGVPVVTDVHTPQEAENAARYADVLQIPAFLCRQTELLVAAAKTGKFVNIKKGQFLGPEGMNFPLQKLLETGNQNVWITERGTTFGYQDLVVDMRGIPVMKNYSPVIMDVTHSLQQPNQSSGVTGGKPELIETIAKSAIAAGVDGIFIETHPDPKNALSDGANMLHLDKMELLLEKLLVIRKAYLKTV